VIIAHDIGTSADKASLHDMTGRMIATATSPYAVDFGVGGRAEQDPELWWRAVVATTTELLDQSGVAPREIDAVGLSGQMMGAVFLGQDFAPVRPAVIWADQRAGTQAARLTAHIPAEDSYRRTGHRLSASYSLPKVMWVQENEPEVWEKTSHVCLAKDFIAHRMTGRLLTDPSDASGTGAFTQVSRAWWPEMFEAAGVSSDLFPDVMSSTTIAGGLRPGAAAELGLAVGSPVVLGGGDGPMASVGVGSLGPEDDAYISLGSSAWIATASDQPLHDPLMRTFTFNHVVPAKYVPMATMQSAGSSLDWVTNLLRPGAGHDDVSALLREAGEVRAAPEGLFFLPYLMGERSPRWSTDARGTFLGLSRHHDHRHLVRAVLEGVAFNLRACVEAFKAGGTTINTVSVVGGGAASDLWLQILADVLGVPVSRRSTISDANSLGCAITTLVGVGAVDGFDVARKQSSRQATFLPGMESDGYALAAEHFESAYCDLTDWFARMGDLRRLGEAQPVGPRQACVKGKEAT
jgi:xylulokinase